MTTLSPTIQDCLTVHLRKTVKVHVSGGSGDWEVEPDSQDFPLDDFTELLLDSVEGDRSFQFHASEPTHLCPYVCYVDVVRFGLGYVAKCSWEAA